MYFYVSRIFKLKVIFLNAINCHIRILSETSFYKMAFMRENFLNWCVDILRVKTKNILACNLWNIEDRLLKLLWCEKCSYECQFSILSDISKFIYYIVQLYCIQENILSYFKFFQWSSIHDWCLFYWYWQ